MIDLTVKLPESTYYQLRAAAKKDNRPVNDLLAEMIFQRFPASTQAEQMQVAENVPEYASQEFVAEWTLFS